MHGPSRVVQAAAWRRLDQELENHKCDLTWRSWHTHWAAMDAERSRKAEIEASIHGTGSSPLEKWLGY